MSNLRLSGKDELLAAFDEARAATLGVATVLDDTQWRPPYHPGVQPVAWDLLHIGWFAEFWLLRGPHRLDLDGTVRAARHERITGPDEQLDSARIGHRARWDLPLPDREGVFDRLQRQLLACKNRVAGGQGNDRDLYHARFAVFHELVHHEAMVSMCDLLSLPAPAGMGMRVFADAPPLTIAAGEHEIGRHPDELGFAFDNEMPSRGVELAAFSIDHAPVSNARFLEFVRADGYQRAEFWPGPAGVWLQKAERQAPERWRRLKNGDYAQRWFSEWRPLPLAEPVVHVNAFEAEAFCRFAGRRLPHAAEWEAAAPRLAWGQSVWEWTVDPFAPYPGFRPGPDTTYSAPWFHSHRELRGGAFATHRLLHDRRYRNFHLPQRTDVFGGFRTAGDA